MPIDKCYGLPVVVWAADEEEDEEIEWESEDGGTVARRDGTVRAKASDLLPAVKGDERGGRTGDERGGPSGPPRKGECSL